MLLRRSDQWLLRYSRYNILRLSSIGCPLPFKQYSILVWSPRFKFTIWRRSDQWLLRFSTLIFWGHLPLDIVFNSKIIHFMFVISSTGNLKQFLILIWSPQLKFKIWERSDQWLLRYSTFSILRSSSSKGLLHFEQFSIWIGYSKLTFKIWGRSNQPLKFYMEYIKIWM